MRRNIERKRRVSPWLTGISDEWWTNIYVHFLGHLYICLEIENRINYYLYIRPVRNIYTSLLKTKRIGMSNNCYFWSTSSQMMHDTVVISKIHHMILSFGFFFFFFNFKNKYTKRIGRIRTTKCVKIVLTIDIVYLTNDRVINRRLQTISLYVYIGIFIIRTINDRRNVHILNKKNLTLLFFVLF
jgi:hypothetical protein